MGIKKRKPASPNGTGDVITGSMNLRREDLKNNEQLGHGQKRGGVRVK